MLASVGFVGAASGMIRWHCRLVRRLVDSRLTVLIFVCLHGIGRTRLANFDGQML